MEAYYARKAVESLVAARKRERLASCPPAEDLPPPEEGEGAERVSAAAAAAATAALPELGGLSTRESAALVAVGAAVGEAGEGHATGNEAASSAVRSEDIAPRLRADISLPPASQNSGPI